MSLFILGAEEGWARKRTHVGNETKNFVSDGTGQ
jgi:hypothetical protein